MNISVLTLRDLEYLVAVAAHRHFGKAAKAVHISQPALSGQIKKIEGFLGLRLFERSNRQVVITPIGKKVAEQAHVVLEEAKKILDLARDDHEIIEGTLRLGAIATLGPYYLPQVISLVRKQFPKLELHLREGLTHQLLGELRAGTLDAVLASTITRDDLLKLFPLFIEPFLFASPKDHFLANKKPLRTIDLQASEMIFLEDGHCLRDQILETCPANRRGNIRQYHATSLETLKHIVATGRGYTLIPLLAVKDNNSLKQLISYRVFDGKSPGREITLICRKRFSRMNDIEALAVFLKDNRPEGTLSL